MTQTLMSFVVRDELLRHEPPRRPTGQQVEQGGAVLHQPRTSSPRPLVRLLTTIGHGSHSAGHLVGGHLAQRGEFMIAAPAHRPGRIASPWPRRSRAAAVAAGFLTPPAPPPLRPAREGLEPGASGTSAGTRSAWSRVGAVAGNPLVAPSWGLSRTVTVWCSPAYRREPKPGPGCFPTRRAGRCSCRRLHCRATNAGDETGVGSERQWGARARRRMLWAEPLVGLGDLAEAGEVVDVQDGTKPRGVLTTSRPCRPRPRWGTVRGVQLRGHRTSQLLGGDAPARGAAATRARRRRPRRLVL